jgi:prevent-host-death family protein
LAKVAWSGGGETNTPRQLREAQKPFSEVVRRALERGPQVVTRHGEAAVVIVSVREFEALQGERPAFKEFLRQAPDLKPLNIERDRRPARKMTL